MKPGSRRCTRLKTLQECKQAWKKDVAEKEAALSATHARLVAKVQAEHAEVIQSLRSQYNASVAELKKVRDATHGCKCGWHGTHAACDGVLALQNLEEAAQRQEKEYMERSKRDHQEHERRVAQLASERRAELAQAEQEKEAAIKVWLMDGVHVGRRVALSVAHTPSAASAARGRPGTGGAAHAEHASGNAAGPHRAPRRGRV